MACAGGQEKYNEQVEKNLDRIINHNEDQTGMDTEMASDSSEVLASKQSFYCLFGWLVARIIFLGWSRENDEEDDVKVFGSDGFCNQEIENSPEGSDAASCKLLDDQLLESAIDFGWKLLYVLLAWLCPALLGIHDNAKEVKERAEMVGLDI